MLSSRLDPLICPEVGGSVHRNLPLEMFRFYLPRALIQQFFWRDILVGGCAGLPNGNEHCWLGKNRPEVWAENAARSNAGFGW